MNAVEVDLSDFVAPEEWRVECASGIFKTRASMEWFLRLHRRELAESGAFILRRGPQGNLVHKRLMAVAVQKVIQSKSLAVLNQKVA